MERDSRDSAPEEHTKTLVLLCQELDGRGSGLDFVELRRWFQEKDPTVQIDVVRDLCNRPKALSDASIATAASLVLGVCSTDFAEVDVDADVRKAGLDPLAVAKLNLGGYCTRPYSTPVATEKAKVLLSAAVARARAFPGSKPEHVRPRLVRGQQKLSRRALFTLPPIRYQPVAAINLDRCVSEAGCQQCVGACPYDALAIRDGRVLLDKSRCQACGLCLVACPRRAIDLPTHSLPQLEAQMTALLQTATQDPVEPRAILFVCERNAAVLEKLPKKKLSYPAGWLPLHVPCAEMVSGSWLLSCLAWGADAVGVLACDSHCTCRRQERVEGTVAYCREVLAMLGGSPDDVRLLHPSPETALAEDLNQPLGQGTQRRAGDQERPAFSGPLAAAQALKRLADDYGISEPLPLSHPFSPLGLVRIDADKCTACGGCVRVCPTGALTFQEGDGTTSLTFDATRCTGCRQCIGWCPEASEVALRVEKVTDLQALSQGSVTLHQDTDVRCELCGAVIGPTAMLRRIETLLTSQGNTSAATMERITRRCPSCRVARVGGNGLFSGS